MNAKARGDGLADGGIMHAGDRAGGDPEAARDVDTARGQMGQNEADRAIGTIEHGGGGGLAHDGAVDQGGDRDGAEVYALPAC